MGDHLQLSDFLVREVFLLRQQVHVCGLLLGSLLGHGVADCLQDALARDQRFFIHVESLAFAFEHFGLHLTFEVGPQLRLLLAILIDPPLIVLIVANLSNCCESIWTDFGDSSSCLHFLRSDLFGLDTGMQIIRAVCLSARRRSDCLASEGGHPERLWRVRVRKSAIPLLDFLIVILLEPVQFERDFVEFIGLFSHHVSPVLKVVFSLLLPHLLEGVEFFCQRVRSACLLHFELGLRHDRRLLIGQRKARIRQISQSIMLRVSKCCTGSLLTSKCLLIKSSLSLML